jgi:hypothetical protein
MGTVRTIINLAIPWIQRKIKLPFNLNTVKSQAIDIGFNQGLPAVVESFEAMVPPNMRDKLAHPMWQAVKNASHADNAEEFVQKASTALQNSGQIDEIIETIKS